MNVWCIFRITEYEGNSYVSLFEIYADGNAAEERLADLTEVADLYEELGYYYTLEEWEVERVPRS